MRDQVRGVLMRASDTVRSLIMSEWQDIYETGRVTAEGADRIIAKKHENVSSRTIRRIREGSWSICCVFMPKKEHRIPPN